MVSKRSRVYLEEHWLPRIGRHAPILDIGKRDYTAHYAELAGTDRYVSVDIDADQRPDIVADVTSPGFVAKARARHADYGGILCNGVLGYGIDTLDALDAGLRNLCSLLRRGGVMLVGWNEWDIDRHQLGRALRRHGMHNVLIEGREVFEPVETEGYEYLRHRYTRWHKR